MGCCRNVMKRSLALVLTLSVCSLSLGCLLICAAHAETICAPDEVCVTLTGQDECCSIDSPSSLPPDSVQKSPTGFTTRLLPTAAIFGFHSHRQTPNPIATALQPTISPPSQRSLSLRI